MKSWVIIFTFQVFWLKKNSNYLDNSGLESRFLFCLNISVLLDVQANLPETSPFFVYPNGFGEHLFQGTNQKSCVSGHTDGVDCSFEQSTTTTKNCLLNFGQNLPVNQQGAIHN